MLLHETARVLDDKLWKMSLNVVWLSFIAFPVLLLFVYVTDRDALYGTITALSALSPIWLPIYLLSYLWISWIHYVRHLFWFRTDWVLLEIELPAEVTKSPLAVDLFLTSIFHTGSETTFLNRIWQGRFRNTWSLEIASIEGRVGFYMNVRRGWKDAIEGRLYGQFPEAKVREVEDYIAKIPYNNEEYDMWCGEYGKGPAKPQAAPIKTYVDFGLDREPDTPETKVDPLTNVLEIFNNMGKDEYVWFQIIMRAHAKEDYFGLYKLGDSIKKGARDYIQGKVKGAAERAKKIIVEDLGVTDPQQQAQAIGRGMTMLTEVEKDEIAAIERNLNKPIYECGLRVVYIAKKEKFKGITGAFLFRFFDAFWGPFNRVQGIIGRGMIGFDYPWEDPLGFRRPRLKNLFYFHSKHRAYFYVPYDQVPVMLSTEELATIWHFPSSQVKTPGLTRVPARVSEAPSNIPTLPT